MKPTRSSQGGGYKHLREQPALPGKGGLARIWSALWNTAGGIREGLKTEAAIKVTKDLASAGVFFAIALAGLVWTAAILTRFGF